MFFTLDYEKERCLNFSISFTIFCRHEEEILSSKTESKLNIYLRIERQTLRESERITLIHICLILHGLEEYHQD